MVWAVLKDGGCFNKHGSKGNEVTGQTYEGYGGIEHNLQTEH